MLLLHLIFATLLSHLTVPISIQESDLPDWVNELREPNRFVVQTEQFPSHFAAMEGLLPAVRTEVSDWASRKFGRDCEAVVAGFELEEFREVILEEIVHKSRVDYDDEIAERIEADHDDYYVGYIHVQIDAPFRKRIEQRLTKLRLKNRLGTMLVAAIFGLGSLGVLWAYLFTSRLTRGFYISRLRWLAGLLVGLLVFVCYAVSQLLSFTG